MQIVEVQIEQAVVAAENINHFVVDNCKEIKYEIYQISLNQSKCYDN